MNKCFSSTFVLDVQSGCPKEVKDEIRKLWADYQLGNDYYYLPIEDIDYEEYEDRCPNLIALLRGNNINKCLLHFWW